MKKIHYILFAIVVFSSCKKSFLSEKPDESLVVPTTISELQALLDNDNAVTGLNEGGPNISLLFAGTDEFALSEIQYQNASEYAKSVYQWAPVLKGGGVIAVNLDWASPYRTVYYANIALQGADAISPTSGEQPQWNNVKGSALFLRGYSFYQLSQAFCPPFDIATAKASLGLPLRLNADISNPSVRSTLEETYAQVLSDLHKSIPLLPEKPLYKTRPSRTAAYAMLARVYQTMGDYTLALSYADSCLALSPSLMDFNSIDASATYPFAALNEEIIFNGVMPSSPLAIYMISTTRSLIPASNYALYGVNDLRRKLYFSTNTSNGNLQFRGSYLKSSIPFCGLATDEVILIKAECHARQNQTQLAIDALNVLAKKRYQSNTFISFNAGSADAVLELILSERFKELYMRGTRWTDLRRLNLDPRFATTITRIAGGQSYKLLPNSDLYTWPIPDAVLAANPEMPQNRR
jgi:tetratricopeptide (TPR) repeat protein